MTDINPSLFYEKQGRAKGFRKSINQSLIYLLPDLFEDAYDSFSEFLSQPDMNLSPKEIHLELMKEMSKELFSFFHSGKFKHDKSLEYLQVVEEIIPPKLFAFLLWSQDKKEACINILQNNEIELSEKEYDSLYLILMPHRENNKVPYQEAARIEYLAKQKTEFFSYHNKCQVARELSTSLSETNKVKKKPKI
jgi:hypothetical protein